MVYLGIVTNTLSRFTTLCILLVAISGCANTNNKTTSSNSPNDNKITATTQAQIEQTAQQLYLRGSFNLWDYQNEYKLFQIDPNTYSAAATLTQGQRYEFLFSAKDASQPNSNCGHKKSAQIPLNVKVKASCNDIVLESFVFIPPSDGTYEFFIEMHTINRPLVYIKKAF